MVERHESMTCALRLSVLLLAVSSPTAALATPAPDYLPGDSALGDDYGPVTPAPLTEGDSYSDLLAAGYLLALPAAAMTGGLGVFLPVGMHYYAGNSAGGNRAFLGILGGVALGGVVGGLADQPAGKFTLTRGMIYGALSGFFTWGLIDVLFFGDAPHHPRDDVAFSIGVSPDGSAGIGVAGHL